MAEINKLSATDTVTGGDLFAIWATGNGDTRKLAVSALLEYMQANIDIIKTYDDFASFPTTGETEHIYIAADTNFIYAWDGSAYGKLGVVVLDDLEDVDTSGKANGDFLTYNSTSGLWEAVLRADILKASLISADTTNFDKVLSAADDTVQKALETLDEIDKSSVGLGNVDNTSDVNKPVSTAQQTALDLKANLTGATFTGMVELAKGADVASASELPILSDGNSFDVTGTTPIASIATTGNVGTSIKLHFNEILILTHHATNLIIPGGANYTTAAGDEFEFEEYDSGDFRCTSYALASGEAIIGGASSAIDVSATAQTKIGDLSIGESVAVASWSFSGTTITINTSAIHNLSVGQFFTVDGLIATTNAPNGRWEVATVADTDTITFVATDTPTGTPTVSSATLKHGDLKAFGKILNPDPLLLAEFEVTGTALTSINFSGLDINTHKSYRIEIELINPLASSPNIYLFVNGDTTVTNYDSQHTIFSTSASASRPNSSLLTTMVASQLMKTILNVSIVDDVASYIVSSLSPTSSTTVNSTSGSGRKTATVANITQLTFTASISNTIGIGSKIRIYRGDT